MPMLNPRQVEKLMQQMGMKMEDIDATEVVIRTPSKDLVIRNPQVSKVNMLGKDTFQVIGEVEEIDAEKNDVALIIEQTGCSKEEAEKALKEEGDIAKAIIKLKKEK